MTQIYADGFAKADNWPRSDGARAGSERRQNYQHNLMASLNLLENSYFSNG
jgi:hypothetical protein